MRPTRLAPLAAGVAIAGLLSACSTTREVREVPVPVAVSPAAAPAIVTPAPAAPAVVAQAPVAAVEWGRVRNIEYYPGGTARTAPNVPGAVIGGVAGALVGNQVGAGSGRAAATVLGGAAGAAVGSQVGRTVAVTDPVYRVTIDTEQGSVRYYDVPSTGDLHIGDRVRVENGTLYRG